MGKLTIHARLLRAISFISRTWQQHGLADCVEAYRRKWEHHRLNRALQDSQFALRSGVTFRVEPAQAVAFRFFIDMEPACWREMDLFLNLIRGRKRLLDVGAHYGIFSLAFTAAGGEAALAVEPFPVACDVLDRHAALNPGLRIRSARVALAGEPGTLTGRTDEFHFEVASCTTASGVTLPATTLDTLVREQDFIPDTIKIDVEGYELDVLRGGLQLLREAGPLIFLEVHPDHLRRLGRSSGELADLLTGLGYTVRDANHAPVADPQAYFDRGIVRVVCTRDAGPLPGHRSPSGAAG